MKNIQPSDKLVINFSTLNPWSKGLIDRAITSYYKNDDAPTDALLDGRALHEMWEREIKRTGKLKIGGSVITFKKPITEYYIQLPYNEFIDVRGTIDCIDGDTIYEWKSGKTKASDFAGTMQIPFYFMLSELHGVPVEKACLYHYNQHQKYGEMIQVWNYPEKVKAVRNWVDSIYPEILAYWEEHNLPFDPDYYKKQKQSK
jgi:hypothetical protein